MTDIFVTDFSKLSDDKLTRIAGAYDTFIELAKNKKHKSLFLVHPLLFCNMYDDYDFYGFRFTEEYHKTTIDPAFHTASRDDLINFLITYGEYITATARENPKLHGGMLIRPLNFFIQLQRKET